MVLVAIDVDQTFACSFVILKLAVLFALLGLLEVYGLEEDVGFDLVAALIKLERQEILSFDSCKDGRVENLARRDIALESTVCVTNRVDMIKLSVKHLVHTAHVSLIAVYLAKRSCNFDGVLESSLF